MSPSLPPLPKAADSLRVMLDRPELFQAVSKDLERNARALLKKQVKAVRSADAAAELGSALGADPLAIALEALTLPEVTALLAKLDKHHDGLDALSPLAQRQHLAGLFDGSLKPVKPSRATAARKPPKELPPKPVTEGDKIMRHTSMGARRKPKASAA
jgi:hypothetical protein